MKNPFKNVSLRAYDHAMLDKRTVEEVGTRQFYRADLRRQTKALRTERAEKIKKRKDLQRNARQTLREKAGFYGDKPSLGDRVAALKRAGRRHRRVLIDDTGKANARNLTVPA